MEIEGGKYLLDGIESFRLEKTLEIKTHSDWD